MYWVEPNLQALSRSVFDELSIKGLQILVKPSYALVHIVINLLCYSNLWSGSL